MSFFFRPAFYPERPVYSSSQLAVSDDEAYYRRVAEEHQRRAQAALALAQEEERRRRQAASQRLYHEEPRGFRSEYRPDYIPTRPHYAHGPFDFPFDAYESQLPPRYEHLPDVSQRSPSPAPRSREQAIRDVHERRIEEWLQRHRQRELEEAEFRRLKEFEKRRDDESMREMLASFGIDSLQRNRAAPVATSSPRLTRREFEEELDPTSTAPRQVPTHSQTCECGQHIPSPQPVQASEPAPAPSTSPSSDFPTQFWNALSGGRSDEERASILRDFGLNVPFNVTFPPNTRHPAAEQRSIPTQRSTVAPRPTAPQPQAQPSRPAPVPVPVIVRSPAPATSQSKPSTSRNPSPTPVKQSPFAHIESIQTKFDSLRASNPDLSDHRKKSEYLAELNKLLTSLDAVESSGSESIRGARKALVRAVEDELEKVEGSQDVEKHEVDGDQQAEEAKVEVKEEGKPSVAEATHEPQASAQSVAEGVEIKSVSESEPTQLHSIEPTIEEPADAAAQPLSTEPEPSSQSVSTEGESHPEVPATTPGITVSTSEDTAKPEVDAGDEVVNGASQDAEGQPERGRQPTVTNQDSKSPKTRRPPSVEIEEVPDEESLSGSPQVNYKDL